MVTKIKKPIAVQGEDDVSKLGLVHVITGDGKGKTTSSLGLALRASGNGLKVYIIQFLKSGFTGELASVKKLHNVEIEQFGVDALKERQSTLEFRDKTGRFIFQPDNMEKEAARMGLEHAKKIISSGEYNLVVLDEINCVVDKDLISVKDVLELLNNHGKTELILTGRDAKNEVIEKADYVNIIKCIKHPWQKGIKARRGIEY